jgi:hypothetical protein
LKYDPFVLAVVMIEVEERRRASKGLQHCLPTVKTESVPWYIQYDPEMEKH